MASLLESTYNTRYLIDDCPLYIRSDVLNNPTKRDIDWLIDHQVNHVVDLRDNVERKKNPCPLENDSRFIYHVFTLNGKMIPNSASEVSASYLNMMNDTMNQLLDFLFNLKVPVIYFCSAGKDRTGVVSALLLKRLGLSDDYIVEDYMKSKDNLTPLYKQYNMTTQTIIIPQERYMKEFLIGLKLQPFIKNAQLLFNAFQIKPLLYGSLGLEMLLNHTLSSDDIDILIPKIYLKEKWQLFKQLLENENYQLIDEHEHTFIKDNILFSYAFIEELATFANIQLCDIRQNAIYQQLDLRQYLKVYHASIKDGYRIHHRHKKDQDKIDLICQSLVSLVEPTVEKLEYKQQLLSCPLTMDYNHQTIEFSKDRWKSWYERWIGNKDPNYFYRYLYSHEYQCFVGEIAYHFENNHYVCDILIEGKYRGKLFGLIGLDLLVKSAKENGIDELYDFISLDNPSLDLLLKNGFELIETTNTTHILRKVL